MLDSLEDLLDHSLSGHLSIDPSGTIVRVNRRLGEWLDLSLSEIQGKKLMDILTPGARIYYETHLHPLLRMKGFFDGVAIQLAGKNKQRIPVFVNAYERRNEEKELQLIRFEMFRATDRLTFEANLQDDKRRLATEVSEQWELIKLKDQLIAILGHDLRNPLASIIAGSSYLVQPNTDDPSKNIAKSIQRSASRMSELIKNIMDFARTRLGDGLVLEPAETELKPMLEQVIDELRNQFPGRTIQVEFYIDEPVFCDAPRVCQLFSNLLANAFTHGDKNSPIHVLAVHRMHHFELTVSNQGKPIPPEIINRIFQPFAREDLRPSNHGLGLGLYIAAQIARAHKGTLVCTSTTEKTVFTFQMNTATDHTD